MKIKNKNIRTQKKIPIRRAIGISQEKFTGQFAYMFDNNTDMLANCSNFSSGFKSISPQHGIYMFAWLNYNAETTMCAWNFVEGDVEESVAMYFGRRYTNIYSSFCRSFSYNLWRFIFTTFYIVACIIITKLSEHFVDNLIRKANDRETNSINRITWSGTLFYLSFVILSKKVRNNDSFQTNHLLFIQRSFIEIYVEFVLYLSSVKSIK